MVTVDSEIENSKLCSALGLERVSRGGRARKPRILSVLSLVVNRIVLQNEILIKSNQLDDAGGGADFHGLRAPEVGIQQYIERIFTYSSCSPSCFVIAYIYIDRLLHRRNIHLTAMNVHRLLITSVTVAAKFLDDRVFNNAYYARVGGVSTGELNKLEMTFLFNMDFRLQVTVETFTKCCSMLQSEVPESLKIERSIQVHRVKATRPHKDDSSNTNATIAR